MQRSVDSLSLWCKPQPERSEPRDEFAHLCALKLGVVQIENMLLQMAVSGKLQGQVDDEALKKVDHTIQSIRFTEL